MSAVAVVGVGAIGLPMASTLARAGHEVTAVDAAPERRRLAEEQGLRAAAAPPPSGLVVVMVATPEQLDAVIDGAVDRAVDRAVEGDALWVVTATVGPDAVLAARDRLAPHGVAVLDAPVTGGVAGARDGALTLFAAGPDDLVERAGPVLGALGSVRHVGAEVGRGQAVKLVNQLLAGVHLAAAAEALTFARALGLDPRETLELVASGAGSSWMLRDRGPRMLAEGEVEVQSAVDIFVKDTDLVGATAARLGVEVPLAAAARDRFARAHALGLGRDDDSRVIATWDRDAEGVAR